MIRTLASDLSLKRSDDPVSEITKFCERKVAKFLAAFPHCKNPAELLKIVADQVKTEFREITSDEDLANTQAEFLGQKEPGFISIHKEFNGDVLGITIRRQHGQPWDLPYVSVVDSRGDNARRVYFTKWHELVHLLILTDQSRLEFRRTHTPSQPKNPEESLVDVIAGKLAFYPRMVRAHAEGEISFEKIDNIRKILCPSASHHAALLGVTSAWPTPCILVDARLANKAGETGPGTLRALHARLNDAGRNTTIRVIPRFRVPERSIIHRVFTAQLPYAEAIEDLSWWVSSDGECWDGGTVRVKARYSFGSVQAILIPMRTFSRRRVPV